MPSHYEDDFEAPALTLTSDEAHNLSFDGPEDEDSAPAEEAAEEQIEEPVAGEGVEESSGADEEEPLEYPGYLPEDLYVPEEFQSVEEELNWYRDAYDKLIILPTDETVKEMYSGAKGEGEKQSYTDQEIQEYKAIKEALDGNPETAFKMYFGKDLVNRGHLPYITVSEGKDYISGKLSERFGEDYDLKYDADEAAKKGTYSNRLLQYHEELQQQVLNHNAEVDKMKASMPSQADIQQQIEEAYDAEFKDIMTREEYNAFIKEMTGYKGTVKDLYRMKYYDRDVEEAKKAGIEEGKKQLLEGLRRSGTAKKVPPKRKVIKTPSLGDVIENPNQGIFRV